MPRMKGNKIGIFVYLDPETYRRLQDSRNPQTSTSSYGAMIIDEAMGMRS